MRNPGLDILRFVAVTIVLFRHLDIPPEYHGTVHGDLLEIIQRGSWVGVDLFFVLSGFLISSLLFNEYRRRGQIDLKRFLIRRGLKIYPAFWVFIAVSYFVNLHDPAHLPSLRGLSMELLFLQNYAAGLWPHTWSLAIEEHFYFGFAILVGCLLYLAPKRGLSFIPLCFALVMVLCLGLRWHTDQNLSGFSVRHQHFPTHLRFDSLFVGVALSYAVHMTQLGKQFARIPTPLLVIVGAACFVPPFIYDLLKDRWLTVWGYPLLALGGCCLTLAAIRLERLNTRLTLCLAALGTASYSIYLWHVPTNAWGTIAATKLFGPNFLVHFLISIGGALGVGWVMSKIVEVPVLRLRDWLFPSRASALGGAIGSEGQRPENKLAQGKRGTSAALG